MFNPIFKKYFVVWVFVGMLFSSPYFSWCGDGFIDANEECDLGLKNNDDVNISGCKTDCTVQKTGQWTCTNTLAKYNDAQFFLADKLNNIVSIQQDAKGYMLCGTPTPPSSSANCTGFIADSIKFIELNKNITLSDNFINDCTKLESSHGGIGSLKIADYDPKTMTKKATPYTIRCTNPPTP